MSYDADLLVVGAGPAGATAAIWAAMAGLRVKLVERMSFPRHRPGETLHSGAYTVLERLGVQDAVSAASAVRYSAVHVDWAGALSSVPVAVESDVQGYQVSRDRLDSILLARATEVGAEVLQPIPALSPVTTAGRIDGLLCRSLELRAPFVIDATGPAEWLRRHLGLPRGEISPRLWARYGYAELPVSRAAPGPRIVGRQSGWTWTAEVAPGMLQWTELSFSRPDRAGPPKDLAKLRATGPIRGADVTWRITRAAGPGYFIAGDAAAALDPCSSHGVLRALMSGMMAAHAVRRVLNGEIDESAAAPAYRRWLSTWVERDAGVLVDLYQQLGRSWPARASEVEGG